MNYEEFVQFMLECVRTRLPKTTVVEKQEILKNNDVKVVGLAFRKAGVCAAPVIYLEEYYKRYCMGASMETLVEHLIRRSEQTPPVPKWDYENILDFQKVSSHVVYKLINAKRNQALLKKVPNLPLLDFAIVFYVMIPVNETENCSVLIQNVHMNYWKLPISVLYQCAKENTEKICPYVFRPLSEYVEDYTGEYVPTSELYILSNEMGVNGAAAILYPKVPKEIYAKIGGSYYLIPSSIHEFLVIRKDYETCPEALKQIVWDVNENHIAPEEYLSDSIYYFDGNIITKM